MADAVEKSPSGGLRDRKRTIHTISAADGTRLHALSAGPREPRAAVVLAHGITMAVSFWESQIRALRDELLVVAYDHRGHGRSGRPGAAGISLEALGSDLDAVIHELVPPELPLVVVGHSMGGIAIMGWAQLTAGRAGRRADAAVLLNTTAHGIPGGLVEFLPPVMARTFQRSLYPLLRTPAPIVGPLVPMLDRLVGQFALAPGHDAADRIKTARILRATHPRSRALFVRFLESVDARPALAHLDIPTLVVAGAQDRVTPPVRSHEIAAALPDARLHVLERTGHQGPMEAADEVSELIRGVARSTQG